ncbi:hypothetical protein [Paenibacillus terrae]|uniref:hypothetical protein n=1 Tax=Paenibacillus terrae TaxID=159743 RepID=UPI00165682C2|nr:hypothetical protein [Paenibacillus terrae]
MTLVTSHWYSIQQEKRRVTERAAIEWSFSRLGLTDAGTLRTPLRYFRVKETEHGRIKLTGGLRLALFYIRKELRYNGEEEA